MEIRPAKCERAAQFVSLDLDGELSRFERAMLTHHLRHCPACAEHAHSTATATRLVRAAPFELVRISLPARGSTRRIRRPVPTAVATAAVVLAALWLGLLRGAASNHDVLHTPKVENAARSVPNDRYDWPAGLPRGQQLIQFVPGGRFTFIS